MTRSLAATRRRIALLDELRGFCVILMVIYHGLFTVGYYFDVQICRRLFRFFSPVEPLFAGIFVFLCGLCCQFSHNNRRRGGLLAVVAAGVSVVMAVGFPDDVIWFGVLHLLATCILLFAALQKPLSHVPVWAGVAVCAVLFVLCWNLPPQEGVGCFGWHGVFCWRLPAAVTRQWWLYPLGLGRIPGVQADYFPLLPWMFCFFAGSFVGRPLKGRTFSARAYRATLPPLAFLGRHALWAYILHQPLIFGVCTLVAVLV